MHYTIGNFSKRKSARLSDVVERAIDLLEAEGKVYNRRVAILDTIDNVACRTFTRTVFADSLLRVGSLRATARLTFSIDVEPGEYRITAHYLIDSLDRNRRGVKATVWLEKEDGSRAGVYTTSLRRNREEKMCIRDRERNASRKIIASVSSGMIVWRAQAAASSPRSARSAVRRGRFIIVFRFLSCPAP